MQALVRAGRRLAVQHQPAAAVRLVGMRTTARVHRILMSDAHETIHNMATIQHRCPHHGLVVLLSQFVRKRKMLGVGAARV